MIENLFTTLEIAEDAAGPDGLMAGPYLIQGTNAAINRRAMSSLTRRDPWRSVATNKPIISGHSFSWAIEIGDGGSTDLVFDALGDPGRGTGTTTKTWPVGRPTDVRRFHFATDPVEGGHLELRGCAMLQAQIVIERGRIPTIFTEWTCRELTTDDAAWSPTEIPSTTYASPMDILVDFGGGALPVFSAAIAITRDVEAANYDRNGIARSWKGTLTPDVVGRFALRAETAEFASMLAGSQTEKIITIAIPSGSRTRTLTLQKCVCEVGERRLISQGNYEHMVEFAALRQQSGDTLTLTSEPT